VRLAAIVTLAVSAASAWALEPGAKGVVKTVLQGTEVVEIPLEYLGTFANFAGPGYDLHLVRLLGTDAERVGVASGMSGSPVYVDGELIGALAYRIGAMPKEAIAGVTPIGDILDARRARAARPPADGTVAPIRTPVHVAGLAAAVRDWLAPRLDETGFELVSAGGQREGAPSNPTPLRPGSTIGVALVRGDMTIAATGTVTWVDGAEVYAFGHPFFGGGRVDLPLHAAEVIHTLADQRDSMHLAEVGGEIGAILEDRLTAIVGRTDARASMIPFELHVHGADYGDRRFRFEVVRHSNLAPLLCASVLANALVANAGYDDRATMLARGRVVLRGLPELTIELSFAGDGPADHALPLASRVLALLNTLWTSPLGEVEVERIDVEVEVSDEPASYQLESLVYDRGEVRPGQTLDIGCVLRRRRGETLTRTLSIRIPEPLVGRDDLMLAIGPPEQIEVALGRPALRRLQTATELEGVVRALTGQRGSQRLSAVIYQRTPGVVSRGESYESLPPSAERLLGSLANLGDRHRMRVAPLATAELELDGPLSGGLQVRLRLAPDPTRKEID